MADLSLQGRGATYKKFFKIFLLPRSHSLETVLRHDLRTNANL